MPDTKLRYFTLQEAADVIRGELADQGLNSGYIPMAQKFTTDSRTGTDGAVYIAIRGARADGHDYAVAAARSGAAVAIVDREGYERHKEDFKSAGIPFIVAAEGDSAEDAAVKLALEWRSRVEPRCVGITGSMGKTTTKDLLAAALGVKYRVHKPYNSLNTKIGCAMTILSMPSDCETLILELGANHPGEIAELVGIFPVDIAVITEVAAVHIEGFGSLDGVLGAKMEIIRGTSTHTLCYNADNVLLAAAAKQLSSSMRTVSFGLHGGEVRAEHAVQRLSDDAVPELEVKITIGGTSTRVAAPLYGRHHVQNIAAAFSAAIECGESISNIAAGICRAVMSKSRGAIRCLESGDILIDDAYNANPQSVLAALDDLMQIGASSHKAILGGMKELGGMSREMHEQIYEAAQRLDELYLVGDEWLEIARTDTSKISFWHSTDELLNFLGTDGAARRLMSSDDSGKTALLVKGSRSYELERAAALLMSLPKAAV